MSSHTDQIIQSAALRIPAAIAAAEDVERSEIRDRVAAAIAAWGDIDPQIQYPDGVFRALSTLSGADAEIDAIREASRRVLSAYGDPDEIRAWVASPVWSYQSDVPQFAGVGVLLRHPISRDVVETLRTERRAQLEAERVEREARDEADRVARRAAAADAARHEAERAQTLWSIVAQWGSDAQRAAWDADRLVTSEVIEIVWPRIFRGWQDAEADVLGPSESGTDVERVPSEVYARSVPVIRDLTSDTETVARELRASVTVETQLERWTLGHGTSYAVEATVRLGGLVLRGRMPLPVAT